MKFRYEDLDVAKLAKKLIKEVYVITKDFPAYERYGLASQLRRAVISILLNIAEGNSRASNKDHCNFIVTSASSLVEVDCALKIAIELNFIEKKKYDLVEPVIKELYFKLIGLIKYLRKTSASSISSVSSSPSTTSL